MLALRSIHKFILSPRPYHASLVVRSSPNQQTRSAAKDSKGAKSDEKLAAHHPVLGHPVHDDSAWRNCQLAKVIVTREQIDATPILPPDLSSTVNVHLDHTHAGHGITAEEHSLLFDKLPALTAKNPSLRDANPDTAATLSNTQERIEIMQEHKALVFARMTHLRNSNADDLAFENRMRIVRAFSPPSKPPSPGLPEVQGAFQYPPPIHTETLTPNSAALLTYKIRNLWGHLNNKARKDFANVRHLRRLVHQRAKILKYLKGLDYHRWRHCLESMALVPEAVEGELVINRPLKV
jgi:small subunit ribosomal protein S15